MNDESDYVRKFYRNEAEKHGLSSAIGVHDVVLREKETALIHRFFGRLEEIHGDRPLKILDAGCGNGYALNELASAFPKNSYWGVDASKEMIQLANQRNLSACEFQIADICSLPFTDRFFSAMFTERCLINLLDWQDKKVAIRGLHDKLEDGGYFLMIEGFYDGLENNNRARRECGLPELTEPKHNKYFDKEAFFDLIDGMFQVVQPEQFDPERDGEGLESNFISSHYFMARVVHALVTKGESIKNTEFVKFFSFLPPIGNFSPIQAIILKKIG